METELIETKLKRIIANSLSVEEKKVVPEAEFIKDLHADSLDVVEMAMEVEKEFNIAILDKDMDGFKTVQDVFDYVEITLMSFSDDGS